MYSRLQKRSLLIDPTNPLDWQSARSKVDEIPSLLNRVVTDCRTLFAQTHRRLCFCSAGQPVSLLSHFVVSPPVRQRRPLDSSRCLSLLFIRSLHHLSYSSQHRPYIIVAAMLARSAGIATANLARSAAVPVVRIFFRQIVLWSHLGKAGDGGSKR